MGRGDRKMRTFFSDNYYIDNKGNGKVIFELKNLDKGEYKVYNYRLNKWEEIGRFLNKKQGKFKYKVKSSLLGGEADAIMLQKQ